MGANREESQIWSSFFQYEGLGNHGNQWHCTSMQGESWGSWYWDRSINHSCTGTHTLCQPTYPPSHSHTLALHLALHLTLPLPLSPSISLSNIHTHAQDYWLNPTYLMSSIREFCSLYPRLGTGMMLPAPPDGRPTLRSEGKWHQRWDRRAAGAVLESWAVSLLSTSWSPT